MAVVSNPNIRYPIGPDGWEIEPGVITPWSSIPIERFGEAETILIAEYRASQSRISYPIWKKIRERGMKDSERNQRIAKQIDSVNEIMSILIDELKAVIEKDDLDTYKTILDKAKKLGYDVLDYAHFYQSIEDALPLEYDIALTEQFRSILSEAKKKSSILEQEEYLAKWIEKFGDPRS